MASEHLPGGAGAPGPILLSVTGPVAQHRATVAVRYILAIPHLIALYFLGIAALVVAVIGWFGALVTGQLPEFAFTYLSGYLRWFCRVEAYLLLLTDEYPPFALEDGAYPVRLAVGTGRVNRLSVAFRIILVIPAAIVATLLSSGFATIVVFVAWVTAIVAGRLPVSLHLAFTAILRYTIRYYGYLYLLTDVYPAGLFGDGPVVQPGAVPPPGFPGYGTAGPGQAGPYPGYWQPAPYGPPAAGYQDYRPSGDGAAGQPAPGYFAPGQQAPGYPASGQQPPGYPVPGQQPPGYPASGQQAPGYPVPGQQPPAYLAPGQQAPGYPAPGQPAPGYQAPGYPAPGHPVTETSFDAPVASDDTLGYGTPGYGTPGYGTPGYGTPWPAGQPAPGTAAPGPVAGAPGPGPRWELILSSGARNLVVLVLVLGLLTAAGEGAWAGASISAAIQRDREISQLNTDVTHYNAVVDQFNAVVVKHNAAVTQEEQAASAVTVASAAMTDAQNTLDQVLSSPGADASKCVSVACFNTTALPVVNAFAAFGRTLNATPVPAGSAAIKKRLLADTANDQRDWTGITQATSFSSIVTIATNAETVGQQFDNDSTALTTSLSNESTALSNQASVLSSAAPPLNQRATRLFDEGTALNQRAAALDVQVNVRKPVEAAA